MLKSKNKSYIFKLLCVFDLYRNILFLEACKNINYIHIRVFRHIPKFDIQYFRNCEDRTLLCRWEWKILWYVVRNQSRIL